MKRKQESIKDSAPARKRARRGEAPFIPAQPDASKGNIKLLKGLVLVNGPTPSQKLQKMIAGLDVTEDDPGIAISYSSDGLLHACAGVAGSPVAVGLNIAATSANFRAWFAGIVHGASATSRVPIPYPGGVFSDVCFQHLTMAEYAAATSQLLAPAVLQWGVNLNAVGLSAGVFYNITSGGKGSTSIVVHPFPPFLG